LEEEGGEILIVLIELHNLMVARISPPGREPARLCGQTGSTLTEARSKGEVVDYYNKNHPVFVPKICSSKKIWLGLSHPAFKEEGGEILAGQIIVLKVSHPALPGGVIPARLVL